MAGFVGGVVVTALVLVLWVIVIDLGYPGPFGEALLIAVFAWGVTLIVLFFLWTFTTVDIDVVGIPGL